jgi:hypothetical protein
MKSYFNSRAEQDAAVERLLRSIISSTKRYSGEFIEGIDGSDHEASAALILGYVDVWTTNDCVYFRLSEKGADWLKSRMALASNYSLQNRLGIR